MAQSTTSLSIKFGRALAERDKRISDLEAALKALDWSEITPENLPDWKAMDEIGGWMNGRWNVGTAGCDGSVEAWNRHGWTHTRKSNSPDAPSS